MTTSADNGHSAADRKHRRETLLYIVLPIVGVGIIVLSGGVIVLLLPGRLQVSLIADWLLTILCLCPLVLCLFPFCIVMAVAVIGMNRATAAASSPLKRLENLSASLKERTARVTDTINQTTVNASVKFAFIDRLLAVFDSPTMPADDVKNEE